jgi:hypothetical protein
MFNTTRVEGCVHVFPTFDFFGIQVEKELWEKRELDFSKVGET